MWTASSINKFDRLKAEIEERKKNTERKIEELKNNTQREIEELKNNTERKIEELRKDVEWENEELHLLEELKINSEKAVQIFESSVDDFEKKRTLKANDKNKKKKKLKLTNPPIPSSIKAKGGRNMGECCGKKDHSFSSVAKAKKQNHTKDHLVRGSTCRITRLCDLKVIDIIKENLERENLERFRQSCFGRLLEIKELEFQGQLVLHLILNMDMGASSKEKLVFKLNNSSMEFGPREFSQITALRIGTLDGTIETTSSSSIHKKIFKGKRTIFSKEIEEAFLRHKGEGELTLKLALLCFLYGTLLAGNNKKKIDLQYIHLIDDLQSFVAFPWGQVAYEFLASFMLLSRDLMDNSSKLKRPSLCVCGFSVALQIWAYEVIPSLAEYCAIRVSILEDMGPRILCWSTKKMVVRFGNLKKFFTPVDGAHLVLVEDVTTHDTKKTKLASEKLDEKSHANAICSSSAAGDVNYVSDTDDDDDDDDDVFTWTKRTNIRDGGETTNMKRRSKPSAASVQATDSYDESCSTTYMNNYIANAFK